ncbi:MAG: hypothetical protein ACOZQL_07750 [Myxococcota bacterium]
MRWLAAAVLCGCGGPGPRPSLDASVPNRPPRIVSNAPALRSAWLSGACAATQNQPPRLAVSDPDGDRLRAVWFVDDDFAAPAFATPVDCPADQVCTVASPAAPPFTTRLANLSSGVHLVTAVVADSEFQALVGDPVTVTREDGFTDAFTWVLDVSACP